MARATKTIWSLAMASLTSPDRGAHDGSHAVPLVPSTKTSLSTALLSFLGAGPTTWLAKNKIENNDEQDSAGANVHDHSFAVPNF